MNSTDQMLSAHSSAMHLAISWGTELAFNKPPNSECTTYRPRPSQKCPAGSERVMENRMTTGSSHMTHAWQQRHEALSIWLSAGFLDGT